jgi:hypothetical protein
LYTHRNSNCANQYTHDHLDTDKYADPYQHTHSHSHRYTDTYFYTHLNSYKYVDPMAYPYQQSRTLRLVHNIYDYFLPINYNLQLHH